MKPSSNKIREILAEYRVHSFYYFAHKLNLKGILENGILPLNEVKKLKIKHITFANPDVQDKRETKKIKLSNGKLYSVHDLVPLYLTPKTPTLYSRKKEQRDYFFIVVQSFVISDEEIEFAFSDGNVASKTTRLFSNLAELNKIPWEVINAKYWKNFEDGTRKRNAEFLIYPKIQINRFWRIVVNNNQLKDYIEKMLKDLNIDIEIRIDKTLFF